MATPLSRWIERVLAAGDPGLTPAQHGVLTAIAAGDATGAELARRAGVTPAAVSQLIAALGAAGLVERGRGEDDRRRQPLALTAAGRTALGAADAAIAARLEELVGALAPHEARALAEALDRVGAALAGSPPPPRPPHPPRPPAGPGRRQGGGPPSGASGPASAASG
ncbi:MAG: MarR family winged helix-turn-helix transcriptional regulator [Thermoleophilia bacterium]